MKLCFAFFFFLLFFFLLSRYCIGVVKKKMQQLEVLRGCQPIATTFWSQSLSSACLPFQLALAGQTVWSSEQL